MPVSREPETIQRDIEHARDALALTLDELVERTNPKRLLNEGKTSVQEFIVSPTGKKVIAGVVGTFAALVIIRKVRERRSY
ncbi:hypothetical protein BH20ACT5_BH20ACT5_21610 [soil metagenome]